MIHQPQWGKLKMDEYSNRSSTARHCEKNIRLHLQMQVLTPYRFTTSLWQYTGKGAWYFCTLPHAISQEIRGLHKWNEEGWGRLKVKAQLGNSQWDTAIWWDSKGQSYLLPIKSKIRITEKININEPFTINIWI